MQGINLGYVDQHLGMDTKERVDSIAQGLQVLPRYQRRPPRGEAAEYIMARKVAQKPLPLGARDRVSIAATWSLGSKAHTARAPRGGGGVFSTHFLRLARQVKHPVRSCLVPLRLLT